MSYQKTVERYILPSSSSIVLPRVMNLCHTEDTVSQVRVAIADARDGATMIGVIRDTG